MSKKSIAVDQFAHFSRVLMLVLLLFLDSNAVYGMVALALAVAAITLAFPQYHNTYVNVLVWRPSKNASSSLL